MQLLIAGVTVIDGVADKPAEARSIWIEGGRIKAIDAVAEIGTPAAAKVIDAHGKFVIPGLLNANVHLLCDVRLENLARYLDRYEDLIVEAAQVALRNGLTTVFDTWGPRRPLMAVRERVNGGEVPGSRFACAGNIIGFDGPFSADFFGKTLEVASTALANRINAMWVENVGRHLMWLTPGQVAREVRTYIGKGIDFIKYGSNEHAFPGAFLAFSPQAQQAIVREAHQAGLTVQAHTTSIEGLRIAVESGCDLIQHANITGPVAIPETTLELMTVRRTGAVVFPFTERRWSWIMQNVSDAERTSWHASDANVRSLIRSGVPLLLGNDGAVFPPERATAPAKNWATAGEDNLIDLATGHFSWFRAMEEKQCPPMDMLRAATRNIALAYGKDHDLGTLEPGKVADLVILDKNPLEAADNYRTINAIVKNGELIDRDALPTTPLLTGPMAHVEEEMSYIPFLSSGQNSCPTCPPCMCCGP
jgi:imidazolonepropionase-like amidohydrolase